MEATIFYSHISLEEAVILCLIDNIKRPLRREKYLEALRSLNSRLEKQNLNLNHNKLLKDGLVNTLKKVLKQNKDSEVCSLAHSALKNLIVLKLKGRI